MRIMAPEMNHNAYRLPYMKYRRMKNQKMIINIVTHINFPHFLHVYLFDIDRYKLPFNGCPRGVMVKAMNCGIVVSEFVFQSRYYVHFRANTLGKGMNPLTLPPAMGK